MLFDNWWPFLFCGANPHLNPPDSCTLFLRQHKPSSQMRSHAFFKWVCYYAYYKLIFPRLHLAYPVTLLTSQFLNPITEDRVKEIFHPSLLCVSKEIVEFLVALTFFTHRQHVSLMKTRSLVGVSLNIMVSTETIQREARRNTWFCLTLLPCTGSTF